MKTGIGVGSVVLSAAAIGCGMLGGASGGGGNVQNAEEKKDVATLKKICADAEPGVDKYDACQAVKRLEGASLADTAASADCGALAASLDSGHVTITQAEPLAKIGAKLISCGRADAVFEKIAPAGDYGDGGIGLGALLKMEDSGVPLVKAFVEYAGKTAGPRLLGFAATAHSNSGDVAANHIGLWLSQRKHYDHCQPLAAAFRDAGEDAKAGMLIYFADGHCKEAIPLAVDLLASDKAIHRRIACANLGVFGDHSVLPKLQIVADTDSAFEIVHLNKVYYVRDSCRAASGKIQLRGR